MLMQYIPDKGEEDGDHWDDEHEANDGDGAHQDQEVSHVLGGHLDLLLRPHWVDLVVLQGAQQRAARLHIGDSQVSQFEAVILNLLYKSLNGSRYCRGKFSCSVLPCEASNVLTCCGVPCRSVERCSSPWTTPSPVRELLLAMIKL